MFIELLKLAAESNLVTGLRVGPYTGDHYQIYIWIGPRVGDRNEWHERFDLATPVEEAIDKMALVALDYCRDHWNCRRAIEEATDALIISQD
jgi:hypothetical protein